MRISKKNKRYSILILLIILVVIAFPIIHLLKTKWGEIDRHSVLPARHVDDASMLNLTKVDSIIAIPADRQAIENQLTQILRYADAKGLKVALAGARHSMGGHTMYPGGIVLNMLPYNHMQLDTIDNILSIGSGALWTDAIQYLDRFDRSIAVMQAFSSFSIGGSLSVNGHGWQKNSPPLVSSVVSFTLMNAQGRVLHCSREKNTELFHHVLGGYGLFGIILDVKLNVVDNRALKYHYINLAPEHYTAYYKKYILDNPKVDLVFGRLRVSNKNFMEEATLNYFEQVSEPPVQLSLQKKNIEETKRLIFRGSVNSEYGKRLRWDLETSSAIPARLLTFTRNEIMDSQVSLIENKDTTSTDLLHEYFIPERNFMNFIQDIKPLLIKSKLDLLNITIRAVNRDHDAYLNYAREDVFGFVLLFNQKKTAQQETDMQNLTNLLVDAALKNEGTYYLPYRLHIAKEKMRKVYPQADSFFRTKLKYDPSELFNNKFYMHYK
ncbi:MAG: FAD-binding oxidoreductase [Sphingobacterium sp.]|jgi:FAD/FMN-containing dehydrogenase|nr:FAD-binding oxidoreductase [Sphingobacterium sp.]